MKISLQGAQGIIHSNKYLVRGGKDKKEKWLSAW
jgi:hypothetical protein